MEFSLLPTMVESIAERFSRSLSTTASPPSISSSSRPSSTGLEGYSTQKVRLIHINSFKLNSATRYSRPRHSRLGATVDQPLQSASRYSRPDSTVGHPVYNGTIKDFLFAVRFCSARFSHRIEYPRNTSNMAWENQKIAMKNTVHSVKSLEPIQVEAVFEESPDESD
uniref:Uncharacterized protein n=1 Tax=Romanomermis culicivorax TaxID=13658 RepID=A0A915HQ61_ROMCU